MLVKIPTPEWQSTCGDRVFVHFFSVRKPERAIGTVSFGDVSSNSLPTSSDRIVELDSLRGIAAIAVVVYHHGSHFDASPLLVLLGPLYRDGWRAVDFFFVLSGFVLARAYWKEERKDSFIRNLCDRIRRLYPLHFVTLLLVALGQWYLISGLNRNAFVYQSNDSVQFALNLVLIHGFDTSFNGPSWSISTEFMVNVLFFVIILLPRRLALVTFAAAIALTFIPRGDELVAITPLTRTLRGFCVGVLLYSLFVAIASRPRTWVRHAADVVFIVALVCSIGYAYLVETYPQLSGGITLMLHCLLIISAPMSSLAKWSLRRKPLAYLGEISYSVYLVHFPLQLILWLAFVTLGLTWPFGELFGLLSFIALTIGCAALSYRYIELPGKRLLRLSRKDPVQAPA